MTRTAVSLLALLVAAPLPLLAQDFALEGIVLSANLDETEASRTGATVDVVTEERLRAAGDVALSDHLARLPGLSFSRSGGLGTTTALRIRGLGPAYQTVRIDGIDVADPSGTQSSFDFGSLTTSGISRVEVLRGSQSALYGSEAVAGVIDITTWRPTETGPSGMASVEAGSNRTFTGSLSAGVLGERGELSFTAARTLTDGISSAAAGTERDAFATSFLAARGAYDVTANLRVGASILARDSDLQLDRDVDFDGLPEDTAETEASRLRAGRVFAKLMAGGIEHDLSYAIAETERSYPGGFIETYEGDRRVLNYEGTADVTDRLGLSFGAERAKETFMAGSDAGEITTDSLYGEARFAATPDLDLSLALRHDDPTDFDAETTGRLALAWRIEDDLILRAVAGTGYRTPALFERYSPYGAASLQPETSHSYELGIEKLFGEDGSLQATLFDTTITDRIDFVGTSTDCASGFGCYEQVEGDTRSRGLELSARAPVSQRLAVFGSYTYTDARTENDGATTRAVRTPRHDLVLGIEGGLTDRLRGTLALQHVADVMDTATFGAPDAPLDDWTVVNTAITYEVSATAEAYLRVENLFDEDYQTVRGYAQPGRSVFAGLRARF